MALDNGNNISVLIMNDPNLNERDKIAKEAKELKFVAVYCLPPSSLEVRLLLVI